VHSEPRAGDWPAGNAKAKPALRKPPHLRAIAAEIDEIQGDAKPSSLFVENSGLISVALRARVRSSRLNDTIARRPTIRNQGARSSQQSAMRDDSLSDPNRRVHGRLWKGPDVRACDGGMGREVRVGRKVYLILDNLGLHHSKPVKAGRAQARNRGLLPAQLQPELNPNEMANPDLKQAVTKLAPTRTKQQHVMAKAMNLSRVQRQPERIRSYFQHAPVRYTA
jgi:hypothetical protein